MPDLYSEHQFIPADPSVTKAPVWKVIDGILYVDGVKIQPWQLTKAEMKQYLPDLHRTTYDEDDCPLCGMAIKPSKQSISQHLKNRHTDVWGPQQVTIEAMDYITTIDHLRSMKKGA